MNACTPSEGTIITYTITVTNHGPADTPYVVISDTLPGGASYVSDDGGGAYVDGVWKVGSLVDGESATLRVAVEVVTGTAGAIIANTAAISESGRTDLFPNNDRAGVIVAAQQFDAVAVTVTPGEGGVLVYTDTQGLTTTVEAPAGSVTDTVTLIYTPISEPVHPTSLRFAGHAFSLEAYQGAVLLPGYVFKTPITITIRYSDDDVDGIDEETLALEYWNYDAWEDIACGIYDHHPDENWLSVPICHLSALTLSGSSLSAPVGGVTMPVGPMAFSWLWIARVAVAVLVIIVALMFRRRAT